jgi:hypothetical protein
VDDQQGKGKTLKVDSLKDKENEEIIQSTGTFMRYSEN